MPTRKLILTEDLRKVLTKISGNIAQLMLSEAVDEEILSKPEKGFNYFDLSHTQKGHLSYLTKDRIDQIEADDKNYWDVKRRYHARPGSVIKKLFKISDWEVETFTTQFLSIVDPPIYKMEVIKGADIAKYYNSSNYYERRGSLGGSCMAGAPANFFDIYVNNPNQINMLVMLDQYDKVMGRALLWIGKDFKLLDRIYVCNDIYQHYFYDWANENGCYTKEYNNYNTPKHIVYKGEKIFKEFEIQLEKSDFERYPYLDTFKWLNILNHTLYNYIPKEFKLDMCLTKVHPKDCLITVSDHQGAFHPYDFFDFCEMTNNLHMKGDIMYLDYLNKNVFSGKVVHSYTLDLDIWEDHAIVCDEIRDRIFGPDYDHLNNYKLIDAKKKEYEEKRKRGSSLKSSLSSKGGYDYFDDDWWSTPTSGYSGASNPCAEVVAEQAPRVERVNISVDLSADQYEIFRVERERDMEEVHMLYDELMREEIVRQSETESSN